MTSLQTTTSRRANDGREQLHDGMRRTVQRGRLLASVGIALLCFAALIGGLFLVAVKDVLFDLPAGARLGLLIILLFCSMVAFVVLAIKPWLNGRYNRAAGEQIDRAAQVRHQPVTLGLSMSEPMDDDTLAMALLQRAEARATEVATSVNPQQVYPLSRLRRHGMWIGLFAGLWLCLLLGLWLVIAIIVPAQDFSITSRVLTPWRDSPPFSLTHLEPSWTPEQIIVGEGVMLSVQPTGLMPESVDWVRLDEQGNEAERFTMASDGQGGFTHLLAKIQAPLDFRLEARGRDTRAYTITPTPRPQTAEDEGETPDDNTTDVPDGSTTFDPDKIARRNLDAHRDWPGTKADLQRLLKQLSQAQALAQSLDPADAEALNALAKQLAELTDEAQKIAGHLAAMQDDLPTDAAALLDDLAAALTNMQSALLPAPPSAGPAGTASGQPTPADWLDQVDKATKADQQRIGQGVGPSDLAAESGTASGQPGDGLEFRDPNASGTYDETNISGNDGPLPEAAMLKVPPSYHDFVSAYFERLAEDDPKP